MAALLVQGNQPAAAMQHLRRGVWRGGFLLCDGLSYPKQGSDRGRRPVFLLCVQINPQMVAARTWLAHLSKSFRETCPGVRPKRPGRSATRLLWATMPRRCCLRGRVRASARCLAGRTCPVVGARVRSRRRRRSADAEFHQAQDSSSEDTGTSEATDSPPPLPRCGTFLRSSPSGIVAFHACSVPGDRIYCTRLPLSRLTRSQRRRSSERSHRRRSLRVKQGCAIFSRVRYNARRSMCERMPGTKTAPETTPRKAVYRNGWRIESDSFSGSFTIPFRRRRYEGPTFTSGSR